MGICDCNQGRLPCSCKPAMEPCQLVARPSQQGRTYEALVQANAQVAALREELAEVRKAVPNSTRELVDLRKSLTAAEQRNAILESGLRDVISKCKESWTQTAIEMFAQEALESAALKPNESGASE